MKIKAEINLNPSENDLSITKSYIIGRDYLKYNLSSARKEFRNYLAGHTPFGTLKPNENFKTIEKGNALVYIIDIKLAMVSLNGIQFCVPYNLAVEDELKSCLFDLNHNHKYVLSNENAVKILAIVILICLINDSEKINPMGKYSPYAKEFVEMNGGVDKLATLMTDYKYEVYADTSIEKDAAFNLID